MTTAALANQASPPWRLVRDYAGRFVLVLLYSALFVRFLLSWYHTGRVTSLAFALTSGLILYFSLCRRSAIQVDTDWGSRVATVVGTYGQPLLRAQGSALVPDTVSTILVLAGVCVTGAGLVALGRSFGLVPANRGVVATGIYRFIRHPLYAGYMLLHIGVILAYPSGWNLACWLSIDGAQLWRISNEERLLSKDESYRAYQRSVPWRVCPGLW